MPSASRRAFARKLATREMKSTCIITRGASTVYTGRCFYAAVEAHAGQLSEPDPAEADVSSYESYNIWLPYSIDPALVNSGDQIVIDGTLTLTIVAEQIEGTAGVALQLRGVQQRTTTPMESITFVRVDPETGDETELGPYAVQVVLESAIPTQMGQQIHGGSVPYLEGYLVFANLATDIKAGDRFKWNGKWGVVTGIAARANDRLEVRMRLAVAGVA